MSLHGRHGFPVGNSSKYSSRPTGLRSRESPSPAHPPISLSPPNSTPAQLDPSKTRSRAVKLSDAAPLTPTTSDSENRKKSWVDSASKTLGLTKLRHKASFTRGRIMTDNSAAPSRTQSTRKLSVQPHNLAGSSRSPLPAPLSYQQNPSPPDKPLPSLPVATVKFQSPVRRSLIDCTERPLRRRSMTPPDGAPLEADWPTIEPTKSDTNLPFNGSQSQVKPSLGESLYEGLRALNLQDNKENNVQAEPKVQFGDIAVPHTQTGSQSDAKNLQNPNEELLTDGKTRPLSSSQLPKPRDSLLQSLSRRVDNPAVRQTKISTLRLQQATGKSPWDPHEKKSFANSQIPLVRERSESPCLPRSKQDFQGGPVRTNSRGRYGVTGRGSPYTIPSRANSSRKPAPRDEANIYRRAFRAPAIVPSLEHSEDVPPTQSSSSPKQILRKSSLPLPVRLVCQSSNLGDEHDVVENSPTEPFVTLKLNKQQETNGMGSHSPDASVGHDGAYDNSNTREASLAATSKLLNVKELLSTPAPAPGDDVSFVDSDEDISGISTHGYDSFGGYRTRRLGNGSNMGPTLRITDSASRVLLGDGHPENVLAAHCPNVTLRHKGSAPDIGSPRVAKDQARRSSAIFTSPMTLVRNFTDRSTSQHKNANEDDTRYLINRNSSIDTVVRAELPGSEVYAGTGSTTNSQSDQNPAEATPRMTPSNQGTPKSDHGDWPGKDFADLKLCSESTATASKDGASLFDANAEPIVQRRMPSKSPSRPPTIVLREAPSKETAPFLFQDLKQEQAKQEKLANDLAKAAASSSESSIVTQPVDSTGAGGSTTTPFPPRTSSRKPKPPPIVISPPTMVSFPAVVQAPKAYAIRPENLKKPRNVKTFSQSVSPRTDSASKGRKISGVLAHSPSSSGKKKVVSSIRGLFHKRSIELQKAAATANLAGTNEEADPPVPNIPVNLQGQATGGLGRGSFRRKPVPTSGTAGNDNHGKKFVNPLRMYPSSQGEAGAVPTTRNANRNGMVELDHPGTGMRTLKHKNPFMSPTTPWTANLKTSTYPTSPFAATGTSTANANPANSKAPSPTSFTHAHPLPSPRSPLTPTLPHSPSNTSPPILSTATTLTHTLLDLARSATSATEKSHLIEISKCMVEVVSSARDAEKAMEKAKVEASRAECAYLKCLKEVGGIEGVVRRILEGEVGREGRRVKEV